MRQDNPFQPAYKMFVYCTLKFCVLCSVEFKYLHSLVAVI